MGVYLIDLQVRADRNLANEVEEFLESKGIEVLGCNGYIDIDYVEEN